MANVDHQRLLEQGVEVWNEWRRVHPAVRPDLSDLDLGKIDDHSDLRGANLANCDLRRVRFAASDLTDARFDASDLRSSVLEGTWGLTAPTLACTDLSGAKLPASVGDFRATAFVNDRIRAANRLWVVMVLACGYTVAFAFSVDHLSLIKNALSPLLPNLSASAPTHTVFLILPIFLLVLYIVFQFYYWDAGAKISQLPRVFPDGRARGEWLHPWFVTPIFFGDRHENNLALFVAWLSVWVIPPFAAGITWYKFLPAHEVGVSILQVCVLTVFAFICFDSYRKRSPGIARTLDLHWRSHIYETRLALLFAIVVLLVTPFLSVASHYGWNLPLVKLHAEIRDAEVSERVGGMVVAGGIGGGVSGIPTIIPAVLRNKNLRRLDARRAFLEKADLRDSDLKWADLREANLNEAELIQVDLEGSDLRGATLFRATVNRANLTGANLRDVWLVGTDIRKSVFVGADLENVDLSGIRADGAVFSDASLRGARIQGADFREAMGLTREQVRQASGWVLAHFSSEMLAALELPSDHSARLILQNLSGYVCLQQSLRKSEINGWELSEIDLQGADLRETNLTGSRLTNASLQGAVLRGANLRQADLSGADLRGADLNVEILPENSSRRATDLSGANLTKADLRGVNLRHVNGLRGDQLSVAQGDSSAPQPYRSPKELAAKFSLRCEYVFPQPLALRRPTWRTGNLLPDSGSADEDATQEVLTNMSVSKD